MKHNATHNSLTVMATRGHETITWSVGVDTTRQSEDTWRFTMIIYDTLEQHEKCCEWCWVTFGEPQKRWSNVTLGRDSPQAAVIWKKWTKQSGHTICPPRKWRTRPGKAPQHQRGLDMINTVMTWHDSVFGSLCLSILFLLIYPGCVWFPLSSVQGFVKVV